MTNIFSYPFLYCFRLKVSNCILQFLSEYIFGSGCRSIPGYSVFQLNFQKCIHYF